MNQHLQPYQEEFKQANELSEPRRTHILSDIMTRMEQNFRIPMLNNEQFNRNNIEIMELYRTISYARDI